MARVCPGTSVILPAMVFLPKRASSSCDRLSPYRNSEASMSSLCAVSGSACHAMSPAAIASSIRLRSLGAACSRYS